MLSLPPTNHFANGRSHSRVVWKSSTQSIRSRASRAQNASWSASASAYRSAVALAWAVNAGSGGNVRSSARRFSISGERGRLDAHGGTLALRGRLAGVILPRRAVRPCAAGSAALAGQSESSARSSSAGPRSRSVAVRPAAARADGSRDRTTRCGRGISMPFASSAASSRLRNSPPAAHCSGARTEPRILSVTPYSPSASIRSTRGASRIAALPDRVVGHLLADLVDDRRWPCRCRCRRRR